jgi:hypothetical protein
MSTKLPNQQQLFVKDHQHVRILITVNYPQVALTILHDYAKQFAVLHFKLKKIKQSLENARAKQTEGLLPVALISQYGKLFPKQEEETLRNLCWTNVTETYIHEQETLSNTIEQEFNSRQTKLDTNLSNYYAQFNWTFDKHTFSNAADVKMQDLIEEYQFRQDSDNTKKLAKLQKLEAHRTARQPPESPVAAITEAQHSKLISDLKTLQKQLKTLQLSKKDKGLHGQKNPLPKVRPPKGKVKDQDNATKSDKGKNKKGRRIG